MNYRSRHTPEYTAYLKSPEWAEKREQAFAYYGHKCMRCGTNKRLQVHHLNYLRLGHELMSDLGIYCYWCHRLEDQVRKQKQTSKRNHGKPPVKPRRW